MALIDLIRKEDVFVKARLPGVMEGLGLESEHLSQGVESRLLPIIPIHTDIHHEPRHRLFPRGASHLQQTILPDRLERDELVRFALFPRARRFPQGLQLGYPAVHDRNELRSPKMIRFQHHSACLADNPAPDDHISLEQLRRGVLVADVQAIAHCSMARKRQKGLLSHRPEHVNAVTLQGNKPVIRLDKRAPVRTRHPVPREGLGARD